MWGTKQTGTTHKADCARVFKNYDLNCLRCLELKNGSKPREGWGDFRKRQDAIRIASIKAHNCNERSCGPVCTFGDW